MEVKLRVLTWNCRRASLQSTLWDHLLELNPDIALLQDFGAVPDKVSAQYLHVGNAQAIDTGAAHHLSGVLMKGGSAIDLDLPAPVEWVGRELEALRAHFTAKQITLANGTSVKVLSVYSPAFPVDPTRLQGVDTDGVKLKNSPKVWATELLWASLRCMQIRPHDFFVVVGDFNSSETLDLPRPRGNAEIIERMNALHLYDGLRSYQGAVTPTFRTPRDGGLVHQLDHLYLTPALLSRLQQCEVGSAERVFSPKPMLSDHLPIVADFHLPS